jgi:hypothetical protein
VRQFLNAPKDVLSIKREILPKTEIRSILVQPRARWRRKSIWVEKKMKTYEKLKRLEKLATCQRKY